MNHEPEEKFIPEGKPVTLDDLAAMVRRGFEDIRTDIASVEDKVDGIAERLNDVSDRVSRLMTREEAMSLFDMARLKVEHDHMKKVFLEQLHVEI